MSKGTTLQAVEKALRVRARLHRLLKKSFCGSFVSGHDFSRADKALYFFPESALADDRTLAQKSFQQPV